MTNRVSAASPQRHSPPVDGERATRVSLERSPSLAASVGRLAGSVRDARERPIAGATVCWEEAEREETTRLACATTGNTGHFDLPNARMPGLLSASAPGYLPHTRQIASLPSHARSAVHIRLQAGGAAVAGTVTDATGGSIAGAMLAARVRGGTAALAMTTSDPEGHFRMEVEPGVSVEVEASAEAYTTGVVTATAPAVDLHLVLVPGATIVGRVHSGGVPVPDVEIVAQNQAGLAPGNNLATSGTDGSFSISDVPVGRYVVIAKSTEWRSEPVALSVGLGELSEPVVLELLPSSTLTMTVHVDGEPCDAGQARLTGASESSELIGPGGHVMMTGAVPGSYELELLCAPAAPYREPIELSIGETQRRFDLERGLALRGRVEDSQGRPVPDISVQLQAAQGQSVFAPCASDERGEFTCSGLMPGQYDCSAGAELELPSDTQRVTVGPHTAPVTLRLGASASIRAQLAEPGVPTQLPVLARREGHSTVQARAVGAEFVFERLPLGSYTVFIGSEDDRPASARVQLGTDGELARVVLSLPKLEAIQGVVVDSRGQPLVDAWVSASHSDALLGVYADAPRRVLTGDDGQFALEELPPGSYDLQIEAGSMEYWATGVQTGTRDARIAMPEPASLGAEVRDARGALVPSFMVTYAGVGSRQGYQSAGKNGRWSVDAVPSGTYLLSVDAAQGTISRRVELAPDGALLELRLEPSQAQPTEAETDIALR